MFSLKVIEQLNSDKCERCGICCETTHPEMWEQGNLTEKQKVELIKERKKYPKYPEKRTCRYNYCRALVFEKTGLAICLVRKMFGLEAEPELCQNYPKELCLRETENG